MIPFLPHATTPAGGGPGAFRWRSGRVRRRSGRIGFPGAPGGAPNARAPAPIVAAAVILEDDGFEVKAIGTVAASKAITIYPQVSGVIASVAFQPGARSRRASHSSGSSIATSRSAMQKAKIALDSAQAAFDRAEQLAKANNITTVALSDAKTNLTKAQIDYQTATLDLAKRTVSAPFAGVIGPERRYRGRSRQLLQADHHARRLSTRRRSPSTCRSAPPAASRSARTVKRDHRGAAGQDLHGHDQRPSTAASIRRRARSRSRRRCPNDANVLKPGMAVTVTMQFPGRHASGRCRRCRSSTTATAPTSGRWTTTSSTASVSMSSTGGAARSSSRRTSSPATSSPRRASSGCAKTRGSTSSMTAPAMRRPRRRRRLPRRRPSRSRPRQASPARPQGPTGRRARLARRRQSAGRTPAGGATGFAGRPGGAPPGAPAPGRRAAVRLRPCRLPRRQAPDDAGGGPAERVEARDHVADDGQQAQQQSGDQARRRHRLAFRSPAGVGDRSQPPHRHRRPGGAISGIEVRELPNIDRPVITVRTELHGRHAGDDRQGGDRDHRGRGRAHAGRRVDLVAVERRPEPRHHRVRRQDRHQRRGQRPARRPRQPAQPADGRRPADDRQGRHRLRRRSCSSRPPRRRYRSRT